MTRVERRVSEVERGLKASRASIVGYLEDYAADLATMDPADITEPGCDDPGGDVRLQWHNEAWTIHTGDPSYDQDHRGAWGASSVSPDATREDCETIADDLIEQVLDQVAEGAGYEI